MNTRKKGALMVRLTIMFVSPDFTFRFRGSGYRVPEGRITFSDSTTATTTSYYFKTVAWAVRQNLQHSNYLHNSKVLALLGVCVSKLNEGIG